MVEFTLCFILLLVIAWIPADFGLMFYTGHLGQNAAREGARIASADPTMSYTDSAPAPCLVAAAAIFYSESPTGWPMGSCQM